MKPTDTQFDEILACCRVADGAYWYAVASTGIYCRPSCRSKAPSRENVRIFASPAEAEASGFRPCKRCAPRNAETPSEETTTALETAAAFLRERATEPIGWEQAAALAHLSPSRFHRLFRAHFGVAPGAYLSRCRLERAQLATDGALSVVGRAYDAGFGSPAAYYRARSRFSSLPPGEEL